MRLIWVLLFTVGILMGCGDSQPTDDQDAVQTTPKGKAFNGDVSVIVPVSNDNVIMAGDFSLHNETTNVGRLALLDKDGNLNSSFNTNLGTGFNGKINAVVETAGGDFIVGGSFTEVNGQPVNNIAKIGADGTVDAAFITAVGSAFNDQVNAIKLNGSGDLLIVGKFTLFNAVDALRYKKLDTSGGAL